MNLLKKQKRKSFNTFWKDCKFNKTCPDCSFRSSFAYFTFQAWRWVVSGVKRTRVQHWSTDPTTRMLRRSMPTWATTGPTPPWWVIHQLWRHTTTATTVMLQPSRPLVARLRWWRPSAAPPLPSPQWLWAVLSPVSSQVSLWREHRTTESAYLTDGWNFLYH